MSADTPPFCVCCGKSIGAEAQRKSINSSCSEAAGGFLMRALFARSASLSRLLLGTFLAETRKVPRRRHTAVPIRQKRVKQSALFCRSINNRPDTHVDKLYIKLLKQGAFSRTPVGIYLHSSSAIASIWARLSSLSADMILTVVSVKVRFLLPSSILRMTLAAMGAQEPFSIRPTVRF